MLDDITEVRKLVERLTRERDEARAEAERAGAIHPRGGTMKLLFLNGKLLTPEEYGFDAGDPVFRGRRTFEDDVVQIIDTKLDERTIYVVRNGDLKEEPE